MGEIIYLVLVASSQFQNPLFLFVEIFAYILDHSLFHGDYFIKSLCLGIECISQVFKLLIFHQIFSCSFVLEFFKLGAM